MQEKDKRNNKIENPSIVFIFTERVINDITEATAVKNSIIIITVSFFPLWLSAYPCIEESDFEQI